MSRLLYIKASPRGAASRSSAVADAYLAALRERLPDLDVDTLDLARERIPDFDGDKVAAKMAAIAGQGHEGRQKTAWDEITAVANRFISADRYLLAVPMWTPCLRARSAVFAPASCSFNTAIICSSVNLARFICPSLFRPDSNSIWRKYSWAGHNLMKHRPRAHCGSSEDFQRPRVARIVMRWNGWKSCSK